MNKTRIDKGRYVSFIFLAVSFLYILSGLISPPKSKFPPISLPKQLEESAAYAGSGFRQDAVYPATDRSNVPAKLTLFGSWLGTDTTTGAYYSPWYAAEKSFYLLVSGYPTAPGNSLIVEIQAADGSIKGLALSLNDPREAWLPKKVTIPASLAATRMRIVATDNSERPGGWFGFSQPFKPKSAINLFLIEQVARIVLVVIAALTLIIGPGLALRIKLHQLFDSQLPFPVIALPGILLLVLCSLIIWRFAPDGKAQWFAVAFFLPVLVLMGVCAYRAQVREFLSQHERKALLIFLVLILVAIAKASYSLGPAGELYGGTISRTLEVGDRSDSRIPFHVVQLVAHGTNPYSELGKSYFAPWSFSHRGPLAGLAASPIVLLSGAQVPRTMPDQGWSPFDKQGFAAYRIAMIAMAATCLLVLFGLVAYISSADAGIFAMLFAGLSPFIFHELYFTWPKLHAASLVLLAFYFLLRHRLAWSGVLTGLAYLFHPLALFSLPALLLFWLMMIWRKNFDDHQKEKTILSSTIMSMLRKITFGLLLFTVSMAAVCFLWYVVNGKNFEQGRFLEYFILTDSHAVSSFSEWLRGRGASVANTLIPLSLYLYFPDHSSINSVFGPSPEIVRFYFQYWNTLPFGVGITYFALLLLHLWRAAGRFPTIFLGTIVIPFLFFAVYWGSAITGMLREGLHVWFLTLVIFIVWSWRSVSERDFRSSRWHSALFAFRAVEIFLMLILPTILTSRGVYKEFFLLSDFVALGVMTVGLGWLGWQSFSICRNYGWGPDADSAPVL